jgi:hypothetical protein
VSSFQIKIGKNVKIPGIKIRSGFIRKDDGALIDEFSKKATRMVG